MFRKQMGKDKQHGSWLKIAGGRKNNSERGDISHSLLDYDVCLCSVMDYLSAGCQSSYVINILSHLPCVMQQITAQQKQNNRRSSTPTEEGFLAFQDPQSSCGPIVSTAGVKMGTVRGCATASCLTEECVESQRLDLLSR